MGSECGLHNTVGTVPVRVVQWDERESGWRCPQVTVRRSAFTLTEKVLSMVHIG